MYIQIIVALLLCLAMYSYETYLKHQISRLIHPEVVWRIAGLGKLYREATLQYELAALPPRSAAAHALRGRRHAL